MYFDLDVRVVLGCGIYVSKSSASSISKSVFVVETSRHHDNWTSPVSPVSNMGLEIFSKSVNQVLLRTVTFF